MFLSLSSLEMPFSSTPALAEDLPDDIFNLFRKGSTCSQEELTGLEERLIALKVNTLWALSRLFRVKRSSGAKKALLIGRLLSYCELGILEDFTEEQTSEQDEENASRYCNARHTTAEEKTLLETLPEFKSVSTGWGKDFRALKKLSFFGHFHLPRRVKGEHVRQGENGGLEIAEGCEIHGRTPSEECLEQVVWS